MIGKTIEMWWWCREGKEKIEAGGGGITELWRRRKGTGVSKKWGLVLGRGRDSTAFYPIFFMG